MMIFGFGKRAAAALTAAFTLFTALAWAAPPAEASGYEQQKNTGAYLEITDIGQAETDFDEAHEDGQYPRANAAISTIALKSVSLGNLASGTLKFGVKVPVHSLLMASYDNYIGIDVSKWNGDIDWAKVKAQGVDYAFIRVGYRGYGSAGTLVLDSKFKENIQAAQKNKVKVGVYFFTQAINKSEAIAEANFVIKNIKGYSLDMPVVIDIEDASVNPGEVGRVDEADLTRAQLTNICKYFCDTVEAAGYDSVIYANKNWLTKILYADQLQDKYGIWLAHYTNETDYDGDYQYWQYSSSGNISGITTAVDLNVVYQITPDKCEGLAYSESKTGALSLKWTKNPDADGYGVYKLTEKDGKFYYKLLSKTASNSFSLTGKYYSASEINTYAVACYKMVNGSELYGEMSPDVTVKPDCELISGFSLKKAEAVKATVQWKAYPNAESYEIYTRLAGEENFTLYKTVTATSAAVEGLKPCTDYEIKVRANYRLPAEEPQPEEDPDVSDEEISDETEEPAEPEEPAEQPLLTSPFSATLKVTTTTPLPPKALTLDKAEHTAVTLSWDKSAGAAGYRVYRYDNVKKTYIKQADITANSYKFTGLASGTKYTFAVKPYVLINGSKVFSNTYIKADFSSTPLPPKALTLDKAEHTAVTLSWDKSAGAAGYRVYRYDNAKKTYIKQADITATSYKFTGLASGTKYTFAVKPYVLINGTKVFSNTYIKADFSSTPLPPKALTLDKAEHTAVTLSWDKSAGAAGYRVYRYDNAKKTYIKQADITATSYKFTGLASGTKYTFAVKPYVLINGTKVFSNTYIKADFSSTPLPPKALTLDKAEHTAVTLSWDKSAGAAGYRVYRYDNVKKTYIKQADITATSYKFTGLTSGTKYTFAVKPYVLINGTKVFSNTYIKADFSSTPLPPKALTLDKAEHTAVTLSWDKSAGAAGYRVYRYDNAKKTYIKQADITANSYKFTGLTSGTKYTFAVKPYVLINGSKVFSPTYIKADFSSTPLPPKALTLDKAEHTAVTLSWDKSAGAAGYRVYRYDNAKKTYIKQADITANSYKFTGLASGTKYTFAVKPYVLINGSKVFSNTYIKADFSSTPLPPKALTLDKAEHTAVTLSWDKSAGAAGYRVYRYDNAKKTYIKQADITATSYKFTGLASGTKYTFAVKPYVLINGTKVFSNTYIKADFSSTPLPPKALTLDKAEHTAVTLSWDKSAGAAGYRVYRYDNAKKTYIKQADITANSYKFTGLASGTKYTFAVKPYVLINGTKVFSPTYIKADFSTTEE